MIAQQKNAILFCWAYFFYIRGEHTMNNQEMLEKLIDGTDSIERVKVNVNGKEGEFEIRPLNSGELSKLKALEKKGFNMTIAVNGQGKRQGVQTNDVDVNAGEFNEYQTDAMYTAVSWSTNLKKESLEKLPVGFPEALFAEVIRISNLSDSDLTTVKTFRKKE